MSEERENSVKSLRPAMASQVAKMANTSISTVSRVFNDRPHVKSKTSQKVLDMAAKLNYQPNFGSRSSRFGKTGNIGILKALHSYPDQLYHEIMSTHLVRLLTAEKYSVSLEFLERSSDLTLRRPNLLSASKVDGFVIVGHLTKEDLKQVVGWGLPVCLLENSFDHPGFYSVSLDHKAGSREAVQYLSALGRNRIGFVYGLLDWPSTRGRYEGYVKAVTELGLGFDPNFLVQVSDEQQNYRGGYNGTLQLLKQASGINAIFYINDWYAIGGITALRSLGIKIPEEISVVGYDNSWMASETSPSLTTVSEEAEQLCQNATNILLRAVENKPEFGTKIIVRPRLVKRDSCVPISRS